MNPAETWVLYWLYTIILGCSLLLGGFTMITYILFKREGPSKLTLNFIISSFFLTLSLFISSIIRDVYNIDFLCRLQAVMTQYTACCLFTWYLAISVNLFFIFETKVITRKFERIYIILGWSFPVALTLAPLFADKIGQVGMHFFH
jgi:hypothetical protein